MNNNYKKALLIIKASIKYRRNNQPFYQCTEGHNDCSYTVKGYCIQDALNILTLCSTTSNREKD